MASCAPCARFASALEDLDARIEDAALVPVPDALTGRILKRRLRRPMWPYGAAAVVVLALAAAVGVPSIVERTLPANPVQAVGPNHPAVAAISLVTEHRAELARQGDATEMAERLKQLGLALENGDVHAYYAGKCRLPDVECDLIVLDAPDARASVVLVPDYPIAGTAVVEDRRMTALVSPAKTGGYIVVADSPKVAKRMQRLFRRG
jgi:hypothetical protein